MISHDFTNFRFHHGFCNFTTFTNVLGKWAKKPLHSSLEGKFLVREGELSCLRALHICCECKAFRLLQNLMSLIHACLRSPGVENTPMARLFAKIVQEWRMGNHKMQTTNAGILMHAAMHAYPGKCLFDSFF